MNLPKCSIIIPIFNEVALTQRCLEALIEYTPDDLYEVVLVDNGSTDETSEFLSQLEGDVAIIRNKENLGFAAACQQGAEVASTDLLLFLRRETPVSQGWLEQIFGKLEDSPKVGAVLGSATLIRRADLEQAGSVFSSQTRDETSSSVSSVHTNGGGRETKPSAYIIYSPPYALSGGVRALHRLCNDLRAQGLPAAIHPMFGPYKANPFDAPSIEGQSAEVFRDAWHVYPEIVAGNPSGAARVIRWLLGPERHASASTDLVYTWDYAITPDLPRLQVPIVDLNIFYPGSGQRSGIARWTGKGLPGPVPTGTFEITQSWPQNRFKLGEVFRSLDYLISNDPFSAMNLEATMCGTPVLIDFRGWGAAAEVAAGTWDQKRAAASLFSDDGFAWSPEELEEARRRARSVFSRYVEMALPAMTADLHRFIDDTRQS